MFKPLQVKAVYIDQKKNAELIPVYEPLANDDNIVAQYYLGRVYYNLPTTPKAPNYHNALRYFQTAASEGWPDAQNAYGVMLMNGRGVPLNRVEAYKWFSIAAQAGHQKAQSNLSLVSSQMTMDEVYEGEKNASYWMNGFIKVNERRGDQLDLSHSLQP
jgi:TPR repeat protein